MSNTEKKLKKKKKGKFDGVPQKETKIIENELKSNLFSDENVVNENSKVKKTTKVKKNKNITHDDKLLMKATDSDSSKRLANNTEDDSCEDAIPKKRKKKLKESNRNEKTDNTKSINENTKQEYLETKFQEKSIDEQTEILNKENFGQLETLESKDQKDFEEKSSSIAKTVVEFDDNHPALVYLKLWKNDKKNWSFKKIQQVWLLKHLYNDSVIPDDYFSILMEYMKNAKGNAKLQTLKEAETLCSHNKDVENEHFKAKLSRAKNVVQYLS